MLQCVAVCCSELQCAQQNMQQLHQVDILAVCCSVLRCVAVCCSVLQCVQQNMQQLHQVDILAVCCSVLQCVVVCCSVLQCVAVCHDILNRQLAPLPCITNSHNTHSI